MGVTVTSEATRFVKELCFQLCEPCDQTRVQRQLLAKGPDVGLCN